MKTVREILGTMCESVFDPHMHVHYAVIIGGSIETGIYFFDCNDGVFLRVVDKPPLGSFGFKLLHGVQAIHPDISDRPAGKLDPDQQKKRPRMNGAFLWVRWG